jgi:hypothetical protein
MPDAAGGALRILGRWRLVLADGLLDFAPDVSMEFQAGGRLLYEFSVGNRRQAVAMLYRVEGDQLWTDHPGNSVVRSTRFRFAEGDVLEFDFAGPRAWFVREW